MRWSDSNQSVGRSWSKQGGNWVSGSATWTKKWFPARLTNKFYLPSATRYNPRRTGTVVPEGRIRPLLARWTLSPTLANKTRRVTAGASASTNPAKPCAWLSSSFTPNRRKTLATMSMLTGMKSATCDINWITIRKSSSGTCTIRWNWDWKC